MNTNTYIVDRLPDACKSNSFYVVKGSDDNHMVYLSDKVSTVKRLFAKQSLSLSDNTLSISEGNNVTLPTNSLDSVLVVGGNFKDSSLSDLKVVLEVYYNGVQITSGYEVEVYWRGIRPSNLSDSENANWTILGNPNINNEGHIQALRFTYPMYKGDKIEVKTKVTYKGLVITSYGSLNHVITPNKTEITSDTVGVNITSSNTTTNGIVTKTYNLNLDSVLSKYATKENVGIAKVITIPFINSNFVSSRSDADRRFQLTYIKETGVGMLKIDFIIRGDIADTTIIGRLPEDSPTPTALLESQMFIGNNSFNIWIEGGSRDVKISNVRVSEIGNKRIIFNMSGIFK